MYTNVLIIHSWLRWVTLVLGFGATATAFRRDSLTAEGARASRWDRLFTVAIDVQVLFGLLLYLGLSPFTREALENFSGAMRNPALRFWAVEHAGGMAVAFFAVRAGRIFALNAADPAVGGRRRRICFSVALLAMIAAIPWPGLQGGRPFFRF